MFNLGLLLKRSNFLANQNIINNKIFINSDIKGQSFKLIGNSNLPRLDGISFSKETKFTLRDCHYIKSYNYIGKINYTIAEIQAEKIHDDKNIVNKISNKVLKY